MLINVYRQRRVPDNVDKSMETGENRADPWAFEDRDMPTSILSR